MSQRLFKMSEYFLRLSNKVIKKIRCKYICFLFFSLIHLFPRFQGYKLSPFKIIIFSVVQKEPLILKPIKISFLEVRSSLHDVNYRKEKKKYGNAHFHFRFSFVVMRTKITLITFSGSKK